MISYRCTSSGIKTVLVAICINNVMVVFVRQINLLVSNTLSNDRSLQKSISAGIGFIKRSVTPWSHHGRHVIKISTSHVTNRCYRIISKFKCHLMLICLIIFHIYVQYLKAVQPCESSLAEHCAPQANSDLQSAIVSMLRKASSFTSLEVYPIM